MSDFRKPTRIEHRQRVEACVRLISLGLPKWQIKEEIQKRYGVKWRTIERYLARARSWLAERAQVKTEEARGMLLDNLYHILRDPRSSHLIKLKTCDQIAKIYRLDTQGPVEPAARDEVFRRMLAEVGVDFAPARISSNDQNGSSGS